MFGGFKGATSAFDDAKKGMDKYKKQAEDMKDKAEDMKDKAEETAKSSAGKLGGLTGGLLGGTDDEIAELDKIKKLLEDAEKMIYSKIALLKLPEIPIALPRATEAMFAESEKPGEYERLVDEEAGLAGGGASPPPSPPPSPPFLPRSSMLPPSPPPSPPPPSGKPPPGDFVEKQKQKTAVATAQAATEVTMQADALKAQFDGFSCSKMVTSAKEKGATMLATAKAELAQCQAIFVSAAASAVAAVAMAVAGIPPWLSAVVTAIITSVAAVLIWRGTAASTFAKINGYVVMVRDKLMSLLEAVEPKLTEPPRSVIATVDKMVAEQKPVIDKANKYEGYVRKIEPDFDIPDLEELKEPMHKPIEAISGVVAKVKGEVPKAYDSQFDSFKGRLATEKPHFMFWIFGPGAVMIVLINVSMALLTYYIVSLFSGGSGGRRLLEDSFYNYDTPDIAAVGDTVGGSVSDGVGDGVATLQDSAASAQASAADLSSSATAKFSQGQEYARSFAPPGMVNGTFNMTEAGEAFAGQASDSFWAYVNSIDYMAYLMPVLVTLLLSLLQVILLRTLKKPSFMAWLVNMFIGGVEAKIKEPPNRELKKVEEAVVKPAAGALKGKADNIFPKFKKLIATVRKALEIAGGKGLPGM